MSDVHRLLGRQLPSHNEVYAHQDIGQSERVTSLCQAVRAEATRVVEACAAECQLYTNYVLVLLKLYKFTD